MLCFLKGIEDVTSTCVILKCWLMAQKELTPRDRVFLKKLIVTKIFNKFPVLYEARKFITTLTKTRPRVPILSHIYPVHTLPTDFLDIHFNII